MTAIIDRPSGKFTNTLVTADGSARAHVPFKGFETLWFNTGTLCNLACHNCYIESSPRNDALVYLSRAEVADAMRLDHLHAGEPGEFIHHLDEEHFAVGVDGLRKHTLHLLATVSTRDVGSAAALTV